MAQPVRLQRPPLPIGSHWFIASRRSQLDGPDSPDSLGVPTSRGGLLSGEKQHQHVRFRRLHLVCHHDSVHTIPGSYMFLPCAQSLDIIIHGWLLLCLYTPFGGPFLGISFFCILFGFCAVICPMCPICPRTDPARCCCIIGASAALQLRRRVVHAAGPLSQLLP